MCRPISPRCSPEHVTVRRTIYALATGRLPAAIAIIRVSGPSAHDAGRLLAGELPEPRHAVVRELRDGGGGLLDEALLLRFDAPASATGEDIVEFHCHGGRAVVDAVLAALDHLDGVRLAEPGEFTRRAFENGRIDLTEAEGLADLLEAETESQRRTALALAGGGLRRQVEQWEAEVVALSARAEAAIDYDEDDGFGVDEQLADDCQCLAAELDLWLARPRVEPLRDGIKVVLAGPPNSGKSSLLNAIVGLEKAIVTDIPGTTRDQIEVPMALGGIPVVLTDTAGLREVSEPVERIGVERARTSVKDADVVLWLGAPAEPPEHPRVIKVHARCDLPDRVQSPSGSLPVSAVTQAGVCELLERVSAEARELLPIDGAVVLNRRQAAAIADAGEALRFVANASDIVIVAEGLRSARAAFDRLTGRAGIEDVLDSLFGRFCLGK